jgi:hypothetical protein
MKQTRVLVGIVLSVVVASGCSMVKKSTGGGGGAARGPLGDTMADGVVYQRGATITAPLGCHTSGYAKLEIPPGETLRLEVSVTSPKDQACVGIGFLKDNGGDAGLMEEVCSDAPEAYDLTTPEGGPSFLQLAENGVCQGATVTIAVK